MFRRLLLFGFGALVSIISLSILDNENKLRKTLEAYILYLDSDHRIKRQIELSDSLVFNDYDSTTIFNFMKNSWINYDLSKTDDNSYPKIFVLENKIAGKGVRLECKFYDRYLTSDSSKQKSKTVFYNYETPAEVTSKSYKSYIVVLIIFLIIIIPIIFFVRKKIILKK